MSTCISTLPFSSDSFASSHAILFVLLIVLSPFVFEEWLSGDRITLSKFDDYWEEGLPKTEQLVFSFIEDPAARLAQLRAGALDFTVALTPDQLTEIESDNNIEAVYRPSFNVG